jgi:hypothetical protein
LQLVTRGGLLTLAIAAAAAVPAQAQTPPVDGGTEVGGTVNSYLELILTQPSGFSTFKKSGSYSLSINAMVTGTDKLTQLSVADGDATSGSKLGFMASGSKRLKDPLEARVGSAAFQPLNAKVDPLLASWSKPVTRQAAKVTLRQKIRGKASGTYRKLVLLTASSETP